MKQWSQRNGTATGPWAILRRHPLGPEVAQDYRLFGNQRGVTMASRSQLGLPA